MDRFCQVIILTALIVCISSSLAFPASSIDSQSRAFWVYFDNKAPTQFVAISNKAIARRLQRGNRLDFTILDQMVDPLNISRLQSRGFRIRAISRWLNAISVDSDQNNLDLLRSLPHVTSVEPVSSFKMPLPASVPENDFIIPSPLAFDYGQSFAQISMLSIDSLHNLELNGSDILIGIMDTGFDYNHPALTALVDENRLVATHDFINGDDDVVDQLNLQRMHGTAVLSLLAGFQEGQLIGSAYGASYVLAKTEILSSEIQAEEDFWIAAAEWMESLGVDIISSSLGYIDWYDTTQLDGRTAAITQAANIATSLGVIVVNAAGNEAENPIWRKITPPADGDSVIAVGAVDNTRQIAGFSSRGPTADGRVKPDFCALGVQSYFAFYLGGFSTGNGTSYSTPLLAGGIALLLNYNPSYRIDDILNAMKYSADHRDSPDNYYGWGVPDFVEALAYLQNGGPPGTYDVKIYPQPASNELTIYINFDQDFPQRWSIHDLNGIEIYSSGIVREPGTRAIGQIWSCRNSAGQDVASGIYICLVDFGNMTIARKFCVIR